MPIHDWTQVIAGVFHHFHQSWIGEIAQVLNDGLLPPDYYALAENVAGEREPDVLTLRSPSGSPPGPGRPDAGGGIALAAVEPKVRFRVRSDEERYAAKADAVVVRHQSDDEVVSMIELVSPGNKRSQRALDAFVAKAREFMAARVHLLVVDLFPPTPRDRQGIHPAVWGTDNGGDGFAFSPARPLTCVAYLSTPSPEAFIEPVAVGDRLPDMPLFLSGDTYVQVPLEPTYTAALRRLPAKWRGRLTAGS